MQKLARIHFQPMRWLHADGKGSPIIELLKNTCNMPTATILEKRRLDLICISLAHFYRSR